MKKKLLALLLTLTMALSPGRLRRRVRTPLRSPPATRAPPTRKRPAARPSGDLINIGFAQVGHESDWRAASTNLRL